MHMFKTTASIKTAYRSISKMLFFLALMFSTLGVSPPSYAQETGDHAELMRLRDTAAEAMSLGDPHGAATNTGKAALMAALLATQETQPESQANFKSLEAFLRAQENIYRAIALFQQSGEHLPASDGVCQTISLASTHGERAERLLPHPPSEHLLFQNLSLEMQEWKEMIEELYTEFWCSPIRKN
ncbi:MAG: hypothetical protein O2999_02670 [Nitrospirae bacterium]|nr:hypothetical protein [Nitrospirota bacterium]MDA1303198.1 hypothetical protein [Nitrospirota bacterium]